MFLLGYFPQIEQERAKNLKDFPTTNGVTSNFRLDNPSVPLNLKVSGTS